MLYRLTLTKRRKDGSQVRMVMVAAVLDKDGSKEELATMLLDTEVAANADGNMRLHIQKLQC